MDRARRQFHFEAGEPGYLLVVDDLTDDQLGEYDILLPRRRPSTPLLLDRSVEGLRSAIEDALDLLEP